MSDREKSLEVLREKSLQCKAERRLGLAREPIEKKIERLIQLQKMANEVRQAAGRPVRRVWGNAEVEG
jgi:hypothetical protein